MLTDYRTKRSTGFEQPCLTATLPVTLTSVKDGQWLDQMEQLTLVHLLMHITDICLLRV